MALCFELGNDLSFWWLLEGDYFEVDISLFRPLTSYKVSSCGDFLR